MEFKKGKKLRQPKRRRTKKNTYKSRRQNKVNIWLNFNFSL